MVSFFSWEDEVLLLTNLYHVHTLNEIYLSLLLTVVCFLSLSSLDFIGQSISLSADYIIGPAVAVGQSTSLKKSKVWFLSCPWTRRHMGGQDSKPHLASGGKLAPVLLHDRNI